MKKPYALIALFCLVPSTYTMQDHNPHLIIDTQHNANRPETPQDQQGFTFSPYNRESDDAAATALWNEKRVVLPSPKLDYLFTLRKNGSPVAFISYAHRVQDQAFIKALETVADNSASTAYKKQLLCHALEILKARGAQTVSVELLAQDLRTITLYKRRGFQQTNESRTPNLTTIMVRELGRSTVTDASPSPVLSPANEKA